jgi:ubiquinone/menaquinone biosynthesis C-methylase UbiE
MEVDMNASLEPSMSEVYGCRSESYASILDPTLKPMAEEILRVCGINGREHVLDLATGTGSLAGAADNAGARVVGADISPGILSTAKRLWGGQVTFVAADALVLPFANQKFNVVMCGLSLSHFPNVLTVCHEVRRVLRPGGRFVCSSWGAESRNSSFSAAMNVLKKYAGNTSDTFSSLVDEKTWASPELGCEILESAGFESVTVTTLPLSGIYRSPAAAHDWTFAWPLTGVILDRLDKASLEALRTEAISEIERVNDLTWQYAVNYFKATEISSSIKH